MGNTSKKLAAKCTLLTRDEQKDVAATFRSASKNSERIREDDLIVSGKLDPVSLEKYWGPQIDPRLAQYLINFLFGSGDQKTAAVDFNRFAELYVYNVRGTTEERMMVIYNSLGKNYDESVELPYQLLKEYCESIASTYIKIMKSSSAMRSRVWLDKGFKARAAHVQALGDAVASSVDGDHETPQHHYTHQQLSRWFQHETLLNELGVAVFESLYGMSRKTLEDFAPMMSVLPLVPNVEGLDAMPDYPAFIDLSHIVWINSYLPRKHQHKWRFLFSSHIHGESFSTMAGRIVDQGASIIIIEDNAGYIFGGFAPDSWAIGPNFAGNEESFLFTLAPKMRIYQSTGYNNHYQYMNHHTKTMANGLLMGGQFEFGAIWVEADPFGTGTSAESCSTYRGYKRLSKEQNFHIRSIELWGVGDKPLTMKESDERDVSILDTDTEAKAILELAGRTRHSEGLREPEEL